MRRQQKTRHPRLRSQPGAGDASRALHRAGAETQLHVFDGQGHCFYYNTALPEALDVYDTILRFFARHLRRRA